MDRRPLVVFGAAVLAAMLSFAYASVFAYEPIDISVQPVAPPVQFRYGSNAGQKDLGRDKYIGVYIGIGNASLSINLHPTFGQTSYRNVSYIENTDSKAYYITFRVSTPMVQLPSGSQAVLLVYNNLSGGSLVARVILTQTGDTPIGFPIPAGGKWRIDFYFYIPESASPPGSASASLQLIYSPSNETPP